MSDETPTPTSAAPAVDLRDLFTKEDLTLESYPRFREVALSSEANVKTLEELASTTDPSPKRNATKKGVALFLLGRAKQAIEVLEKAHPQEELASLILGRALLEEGDPKTARAKLKEAVAEHKGSRALKYALILAALHAGEIDDAKEMIEKAKGKFGEDAEQIFLRGFTHELEGDYDDARKCYEQTVERTPGHSRALFRLARYHMTWGDEDRAIEYYERCRDADPKYANVLINLGTLYEDRGEYDKAVECYRTVLRSAPGHARARLFLKDADASKHMFYDEDLERRADRRSAILKIPVTDFELSVRSRNCLNKMNIKTLGDLIQMTEAELLAHKNFGETSLMEVKQMLAQKGLRLGMGQLDLSAHNAPPAAGAQDVPEEVLKKPITDLEFSVRARKCMERLAIQTVGELISRSEQELLAAKNFGQTSLNEVKQRLAEFGLHLREAPPTAPAAPEAGAPEPLAPPPDEDEELLG